MITQALLETLAEIIRREPDVARLVRLEPHPTQPGRFVYLIETAYESFPRFATGTTDAQNETVHIAATTGQEWSAAQMFDEMMKGAQA